MTKFIKGIQFIETKQFLLPVSRVLFIARDNSRWFIGHQNGQVWETHADLAEQIPDSFFQVPCENAGWETPDGKRVSREFEEMYMRCCDYATYKASSKISIWAWENGMKISFHAPLDEVIYPS